MNWFTRPERVPSYRGLGEPDGRPPPGKTPSPRQESPAPPQLLTPSEPLKLLTRIETQADDFGHVSGGKGLGKGEHRAIYIALQPVAGVAE